MFFVRCLVSAPRSSPHGGGGGRHLLTGSIIQHLTVLQRCIHPRRHSFERSFSLQSPSVSFIVLPIVYTPYHSIGLCIHSHGLEYNVYWILNIKKLILHVFMVKEYTFQVTEFYKLSSSNQNVSGFLEPCSLFGVHWCFRGACCFHQQGDDEGGSTHLWNVGLL
jgi:hypothetical protein